MKKYDGPEVTSVAPRVGMLLRDEVLIERCACAAARDGWRVLMLDRATTDRRLDPALNLVVAEAERVPALAAGRQQAADATGLVAVSRTGPVAGADDVLDHHPTDEAIDTLLVDWRPVALPAAAQRQLETFGRVAMQPLLTSLRARLAAALADDGDAARAVAHQIAGLAGILGLADMATAWEGFSRGDDSTWRQARRLGRLAIGALDRN